ncbi:Rgg/GadR/MutR family transcriptional regulator [Lactobacillus panisapium]|uniref:Rgg family transcriptional regulator n=1 Tax=Lactobacillus panisapium TaxID=2012495 RepID=UPI001C698ADC|nr:Rgg/GadR/MutR family transcriptional regulator [Lactobacillus panisapium]QYN57774.1 Rgg/GadR/MutR family transcriptional regulator [Lactobacillus panisapium]
MTTGELLKDYRISQRKTQKQWAGDVISASFYAKVEKNLSRISADDLIELLHFNQIPLIDFFSKLRPKDKLIHQQELEIDRLINEAYYQNSKKELQQIRDVVAESKLPNKSDELLLIDAYIAVISKDLTMLGKEAINKIKEKVFNISNFDEDGLILYCNFMSFYDLNSNLLLSKKIIKQCIGSSSVKIQGKILAIIINMLIFCIRNKRFEEADVFVNYADQIKTKPAIFFYKMLVPAFYNIVKYQNTHNKKYLDETEIIIKSIKLAGMPDYSKELEELLIANE